MFSHAAFPRLDEQNHRITSPAAPDDNCIAWSAGDEERWWQPGFYWPVDVDLNEFGLGILVEMFRSLGYEECGDDSLEAGFEKVALYGSGFLYTHAARQLPSGKWTSKLGRSEDIEHDSPEILAGGVYGEVVEFMRRPVELARI